MSRVTSWNEETEEYAVINVAYLPSLDAITQMWPRNPQWLKPLLREFKCAEEGAAYTLTARARNSNRNYAKAMGRDIEAAVTTPLDTWVFGQPEKEESLFTPLFTDETEDTNMRVVLHRGIASWCDAYTGNGVRIYKDPHRNKEKRLRRTGMPLIHRVLDAYLKGRAAVNAVLDQTGHKYWHGEVIPEPSTYAHLI